MVNMLTVSIEIVQGFSVSRFLKKQMFHVNAPLICICCWFSQASVQHGSYLSQVLIPQKGSEIHLPIGTCRCSSQVRSKFNRQLPEVQGFWIDEI